MKTVIMPMLQARSLREPMGTFEFGDYSAMEAFNSPLPDYLRPHASGGEAGREPTGWDLKELVARGLRHSNEIEHGLELVDIITNALRRALSGNLRPEGWKNMPRLMIHLSQDYIRFISLGTDPSPAGLYPYMPVVRMFRHGGKQMLAPRFAAQVDG